MILLSHLLAIYEHILNFIQWIWNKYFASWAIFSIMFCWFKNGWLAIFLFWKWNGLLFLHFLQFYLDDLDSREPVNLMHLNLLIILILFHSSQFLDFLCAFDCSFGWMAFFLFFLISFSSFCDFDYLGSRETVNLMHLNLLIIGILSHSSQFLDFLCAFDRSFGWMAANPVDLGEPLYPTANLFTNLWRLEGEIRLKSCLLIGLAVVKVARKKNVIVEIIRILVVWLYMLVKLDYFSIFLLFVVASCVGSIIVLVKVSSIALSIY